MMVTEDGSLTKLPIQLNRRINREGSKMRKCAEQLGFLCF